MDPHRLRSEIAPIMTSIATTDRKAMAEEAVLARLPFVSLPSTAGVDTKRRDEAVWRTAPSPVVDLPSYRPTFRVHWIVPLLGAIGCVGAMFVINARLALFALVAGNVVMVWLARRDLERPVTDIRSAMLVALAQWATRTARRTPSSDERTWSPRLLVPVRHDEDAERARRWLPELAVQGGPVRLVALNPSTTKVGAGEAERGPAVALLATGDEEDPQAANVLLAGFPEPPDQDAPTRLLLRQGVRDRRRSGAGAAAATAARAGREWRRGADLRHRLVGPGPGAELARRLPPAALRPGTATGLPAGRAPGTPSWPWCPRSTTTTTPKRPTTTSARSPRAPLCQAHLTST